MNEKYVNGSVAVRVRMMVRGGCLPVSKYDDERCVCGYVESEEHVMFDCNLYMDMRIRWKEKMDAKHANVYNAIKCYEVNNESIEKETMWYMGMVWTAIHRSELSKLV